MVPASVARNLNVCGPNSSGGIKLVACCGQLGPYEVALIVPLYGSLDSGRLKRLLPILNQSKDVVEADRHKDAYGGFAKGMPKKLVKLSLVEPMKSFGLCDASVSTEQKS